MTNKTTDENVIPFRGRRQDVRTQAKEEQKTALSEEQFKQSNAWFRRAVEAKLSKAPMVHSKQVRIQLANNLSQILAEVRPLTPTKDVLHAAGQGGETESTKRLPYYALNPELPASERDKRAEKLTKSIGKYMRIVAAAARLSGKNESDLIRRFVAGTVYDPLTEEIDATGIDMNVEGWVHLETTIQTVATNISNKYKLPQFFQLVRNLGIVDRRAELAARFDRFSTAHSLKQLDLQGATPLPALLRADKLPPRPSVYLGEIQEIGDIPCTIHVHPALFGSFDDEKIGMKLVNRLREAGLEKPSVKGVAIPVLRVSLDLLPLGRQNNVTPVVCLKSNTYIASAEEFTQLALFGGAEWRKGEVVGEFEGRIQHGNNFVDNFAEPFAVVEDDSSEIGLIAEFEFPPGTAYEGSLHSRSAARGLWVCPFEGWAKAILSKPIYINDYPLTKPEVEVIDAEAPTYSLCDALTFFPRDTMAALLERSLFYPPDAAGLDHLLDEKARILTHELEEGIEKARVRRRERLDELRRE
jgi:hypothetical protein